MFYHLTAGQPPRLPGVVGLVSKVGTRAEQSRAHVNAPKPTPSAAPLVRHTCTRQLNPGHA